MRTLADGILLTCDRVDCQDKTVPPCKCDVVDPDGGNPAIVQADKAHPKSVPVLPARPVAAPFGLRHKSTVMKRG